MELVKNNINLSTISNEKNITIPLEEDVIVRDFCPDVNKVIDSTCEVLQQEIKKDGDKLIICGNCTVGIIYMSDDKDKSMNYMDQSIDFEEKVDLKTDFKVEDVNCSINVKNFNVTLLNSRKINIKIMCNAILEVDEKNEVEVIMDIVDDNIQKINRKLTFNRKNQKMKEKFIVKERYQIPTNKPEILEVLKSKLTLSDIELNKVGDDVILNSNLALMMLYTSDESQGISAVQTTFQIKEVLSDLELENEDYDVNLEIIEKNINIDFDVEGERRVVFLELVLMVNVCTYIKEEVNLLEDAYKINEDADLDKKSFKHNSLIVKNNNTYSLREIVEIETKNVLQVFDVSAIPIIEKVDVKKGVTEVSGVIKTRILYAVSDDDMPLASVEKLINFTQVIDTKGSKENDVYKISVNLDNVLFNMLNPEELELRFNLSFKLKIFSQVDETIITDAKFIENEKSKDKDMKIKIYVAVKDEKIWDVAKKFNISYENIRLNNQEVPILPTTIIKKGTKMLIF